ncbi:MAG: hypothetical protein QNJ67_22075 [Kiloniellales bacterium]|nr:hypothetical protein [Kiloniellales bacterium]
MFQECRTLTDRASFRAALPSRGLSFRSGRPEGTRLMIAVVASIVALVVPITLASLFGSF